MAITDSPLPLTSPILQLDPRTGKPAGYLISKEWAIGLQAAVGPIGSSVQVFPTVALAGTQNASIGTTPIPLPSLPSGLYRLTYYARITTAAGVSSSLIVTFSWTESGVSLSSSTGAITGNTITTVSSGTILIAADAATAISYATTYASNPAGVMTYRLNVVVEAI